MNTLNKELSKNIIKFNMVLIPKLINMNFHMKRDYGHARYIVIGDYREWRNIKDSTKMPVDIKTGSPVLCNYGGPSITSIVIKRIGGYDGPPTKSDLQTLLTHEWKELNNKENE
jgi:hypothetical protein